MRTLRIFISSPGDVAEERKMAQQVIAALQQRYRSHLTLKAVVWEQLPIPATASFQQGIDVVLTGPEKIDIAVFILWSRLGTPLESSITKPDGTPYLSGTEREFDLMLEAFQKSGRQRPLILTYTRRDNDGFGISLLAAKDASPAILELVKQRDAARKFIQERFLSAEGQNLHAYHSYRDPVGFAQRLSSHLHHNIDTLLGQDAPTISWTDLPYRSLEYFDLQHVPIFFGREEETLHLLQMLRDQRKAGTAFVCILGASGSGKSSLARAGVAATLMQQSFEDGVKAWLPIVLVPTRASQPLLTILAHSLGTALPSLHHQRPGGTAELATCLQEENHTAAAILLSLALQTAQTAAGGPIRLVMVLDQMEELWPSPSESGEAELLLRTLAWLCKEHPVDVIATLRSDCYHHAQASPAYMQMRGDHGQFDLTAPGTAALHRMITGPARLAGLTFERDVQTGLSLDETLLAESRDEPDALPLLQYTLSELHEKAAGTRKLTFAAHEELGGMEGAIGRGAQAAFLATSQSAQDVLDEITHALVTIRGSGESQVTRRPASYEEITNTPARKELVDALVRGRFAIIRKDGVTFAHEALLRRWDRLAESIDNNTELLRLRSSVEQSCDKWLNAGQHRSHLLQTGLPLEEGRLLLKAPQTLLTDPVKAYINASLKREQDRKRNLIQSLVAAAIAGISIVVMTIGSIESQHSQKRSDAQIHEAARNAWGSAREAFEVRDDPPTGFAHLARAVWFNEKLPPHLQLNELHQDVALRLLHAPTANPLPVAGPVHTDSWVNSAAFSKDGRQILTASGKQAQLWDARTLQPIGDPLPHSARVSNAAFNPANQRFLATVTGESVFLWELGKGAPLLELKHPASVSYLHFSPDGSKLVSTGDDNQARVWDLATGKLSQSIRHSCVLAAQFSPDGGRLLICPTHEQAQLFDLATSKMSGPAMSHAGTITHATFSPASNLILTASGSHRDDQGYFDYHYDNTLRLWDSQSGVAMGKPMQHDNVTQVSFSADGGFILSASADRARAWDVFTQKPASTAADLSDTTAFVRDGTNTGFRPDGLAYVTTVGGYKAVLWDTLKGTPLGSPFYHQDSVNLAVINPDGSRLLTYTGRDGLQLWDINTSAPPGEYLDGRGADHIQFSPDGRHLLVICNDVHYDKPVSPGVIQRWDYASRTLLEPPITHSGRILAGEFSPDGERFLIVCDDNCVRTYHTLSGQSASPPISLPQAVSCAHFSPDGTRILTGCGVPMTLIVNEAKGSVSWDYTTGEAQLWDATSGTPVLAPFLHQGMVSAAAFSPDGRRIVTTSEDQTARLWDAASGQPMGVVMQHESPVNHASFSADGRMLLTGSGIPRKDGGRFAGSARLWDATTGRPLAPPCSTERTVRHVQFSPRGNNFLTISCQEDRADDTQHHLWSTSKNQLIAAPLHPARRLHPLLWGTPHYGLAAEESSFYGESLFQGVCSAAYHPTALSLANNSRGGASIWSPQDGKPLGPLLPHSGAAHGICYSPDGTSLVTARSPTGTRIWDIHTRDIHTTSTDIEMIGGVRINKDGLRLAVPMEERLQWKKHLLAADPADITPWQSFLRWYLSPRNGRPLFPHSPTTLAEQITRLTKKGFQRVPAGTYELEPLKEAYFLDASHPGAQLLAAGIWAAHADFLAPGVSFWLYDKAEIGAKSHSAIHHADRALALHPGLPLALRAKGNALSWLQDHQGALEVRRQLCASPEAIAADFSQAFRSAARASQSQTCQELMAAGEKRFPRNSEMLLQKGLAFIELPSPSASIDAFAAAQAQNPNAFGKEYEARAAQATAQWALGTPASRQEAVTLYKALIQDRDPTRQYWASRAYVETVVDLQFIQPTLLKVLTATLAKHPELSPPTPPK